MQTTAQQAQATAGGDSSAAKSKGSARGQRPHLRHVGLGQQEDADDGVVLDAVVLGLRDGGGGEATQDSGEATQGSGCSPRTCCCLGARCARPCVCKLTCSRVHGACVAAVHCSADQQRFAAPAHLANQLQAAHVHLDVEAAARHQHANLHRVGANARAL